MAANEFYSYWSDLFKSGIESYALELSDYLSSKLVVRV